MACVGTIPSFNSFSATPNFAACSVEFSASINVPCGSTGWELRLYRKKGSAPTEQCSEFMESWNVPDGPTTFSPLMNGDDLTCDGTGTYYYKLNIECVWPNVYATISDTVELQEEDPTLGVHPVITIDQETCKFTATCNVTSYCGTDGPPKYKVSLYRSLGKAPQRTEEERVPADQFVDCDPGTVAFNWNGNLSGNGVYQFEFVLKKNGAIIASVLVNDKSVTGCDEVYLPVLPQTATPQLQVDELIYLVQPVKTAQGYTYIDKRLISQTYQMLDWWYYRRGGCGSFRLLMRENFKEADRAITDGWEIHVRIKLPGESTHTTWYRGVIRTVERKRQANEVLTEVRGQGYLEQMAGIQVQRRYPRGSSIQWIVTDIIRNFICPNSRISRRLTDDGIDTSANYVTKGPLHFECSALRAIKFLAELQGDFEFGVAADTQFYFRKKTTSFTDALFETEDIVSTIEGGKELTKVNQFKIGGKSYGHEMALNIIKDVTDITAFGLFEAPVDIPWIEHRLDSVRWAENQIAFKKGLTSWRMVAWSDIDKRLERGHPNGSLGMVRIYGTDVSWDFEELDISKIHYQKGGTSNSRNVINEIHNLQDRGSAFHNVISAKVYLGHHHYELTEEIEDKIYAPIAALRAQAKQFRNPIVDVTNPNTTEEDTKPGQFWMHALSDLTNGPFRPRFREDLTNWPDLVKMRFGDVTTPPSGTFLGEEFFVYSNAERTQGTKYYWDGVNWKAMASSSAPGGGTLTGSGVSGEVAYWTGATSLGSNSKFKYDSATGRMTLKNSSTNGQIRLENSPGTGYVDIRYSSFAYEMFSPSSTDFALTIINTNTAAGANASVGIPLQHASPTGDAYYTVSSALGEWSWGMRSSDSSAFLLCGLGNLNGVNRWRVTATTQDWYGDSAGSAVFTLKNVNAGLAVGAQQVISVPNTSTTGDVWTTYQIVGTRTFSIGIDNSDNSFKISESAALGTSDRLSIETAGFRVISASSSGFVDIKTTSSNSAATIGVSISVPATSTTGDPYIYFVITSVKTWSFGIDNSDSDAMVLSESSAIGTSNAMRIAAGGQVDFYNDVITTANLKWKSGTSFLGTFDHANTADRVYTFPDADGTVPLGTGANTRVAFWTGTNSISSDAGLVYDSSTDTMTLDGDLWWKSGTAFLGKFAHAISAERIWTFPDVAGTVALTSDLLTIEEGDVAIVTNARSLDFLGADFDVTAVSTEANVALAALLNSTARVMVRKNTGADTGARRRLNFIEGTGITLTIADDAASEEVDITVTATNTGTVTGTGIANQVAFWTSGTAIGGDTGMTYNAAGDELIVGILTVGANEGVINSYKAGVFGAGAANFIIRDTTNDVESIFGVASTGVKLGSASNSVVNMAVNNLTKWIFQTDGDFVAVTDGAGNIGEAADFRPANIYASTSVQAPSMTISGLTATWVLYAGTGGLVSSDAGMVYDAATDILTLAGDLWWKSGTAFTGKFEHAISAERIWTFPDLAGTVVVNSASQVIDNNARVTIRKNTGADVGARRRLNFIEGTSISITVADDAAGEEVDITIAFSGTATGDDAFVMAAGSI